MTKKRRNQLLVNQQKPEGRQGPKVLPLKLVERAQHAVRGGLDALDDLRRKQAVTAVTPIPSRKGGYCHPPDRYRRGAAESRRFHFPLSCAA
jgi:hypothetical protein